jgi:hypothetical protein
MQQKYFFKKILFLNTKCKDMKKQSFLFVLIASLFFFVSCGKYEDGPAISLLSRKARLVNKWKLEKMYKDGQEQTLSEDEKKGYLEIKKDNTFEEVAYSGALSITLTGTWSEVDNYSKIHFKITNPYSYEYEYTILRLMSNQLWWKSVDDDGHEYEYHYVTY